MLLRILFFLLVLILAHVYVATSLYAVTDKQSAWWGTGLLFILEMLMILLRWGSKAWRTQISQGLLRWLWWIAFMAFGIFSLLFFFSVARDLLFWLTSFFIDPAQAESVSFWSLLLEVGIIFATLVLGVFQALKGPRIREIQVPITDLPQGLEGFRIVQISDLHIGPTIDLNYVSNVVQKANALHGDIIALTGDITDGSPQELLVSFKELGNLRSTFGQFFVTGNHEYYHNALEWIQSYKELGIRVLTNESHIIHKQGSSIAILGVPDVTAHHFVREHISNPKIAAANVPSDMIKILLAHQPSSYKAAADAGVHLQISGHTHGGQFFPWNLIIGFFHDFYRGLNRYKNLWIYVNPGTGYWGPALRTGVPAEITLLVLTRAK